VWTMLGTMQTNEISRESDPVFPTYPDIRQNEAPAKTLLPAGIRLANKGLGKGIANKLNQALPTNTKRQYFAPASGHDVSWSFPTKKTN